MSTSAEVCPVMGMLHVQTVLVVMNVNAKQDLPAMVLLAQARKR